MALRQKIEYSQKPIFNQSLRQSVKILELPLLELKETIEAELVENPVIEEVRNDASASSPAETQPERTPEEEAPFDFDREVRAGELANYEKPIPGRKESLTDALLRQLRINADGDGQLKIGAYLIHRIDENGYLREDIPSLCGPAGCDEAEMMEALRLIQTFEPTGVGARDLKECLLIQLQKRGGDGLARRLIEEHLEDLASKDSNKLCKKLKCAPDELAQSIEKIQALEPKPGRVYSNDETAYVIPDISIEEKDETLFVSTKDDSLPIVRVNPFYKNMLKSNKVDDETKNFIRERLRNATSLIHAIRSRKETLIKVVSIIAETQKEALLEGMEKLKPLTLKALAERVGVHESTISRIVMNKYVQTPGGTFALRDFFSSSLKTNEGEDISSHRIKLKIEELIAEEDKSHPLKDRRIVELIEESEKIRLARRTVAKYREALTIPTASQRRRS